MVASDLKVQVPFNEKSCWTISHDEFNKNVADINKKLYPKRSRSALAPFGGSKVTAMVELDLDLLVMVGWERPGSIEEVEKSFTKNKDLTRALQNSFQNGGMDSSVVLSAPVASQILSRIYIELGVSEVEISYSKIKGQKNLKLSDWDGEVVNAKTPVLLTSFKFKYQNRPREIVFVSWKIRSDSEQSPDKLPLNVLSHLAPRGFTWGYLSADGLIFFSANNKNGASTANKQFTSLLADDGSVILDYPNHLNSRTRQELDDGLIAMTGRRDLSSDGFNFVDRIPVTTQVFGYSGLNKKDEVRVYQKKLGKKFDGEEIEFEELFSTKVILE